MCRSLNNISSLVNGKTGETSLRNFLRVETFIFYAVLPVGRHLLLERRQELVMSTKFKFSLIQVTRQASAKDGGKQNQLG